MLIDSHGVVSRREMQEYCRRNRTQTASSRTTACLLLLLVCVTLRKVVISTIPKRRQSSALSRFELDHCWLFKTMKRNQFMRNKVFEICGKASKRSASSKCTVESSCASLEHGGSAVQLRTQVHHLAPLNEHFCQHE